MSKPLECLILSSEIINLYPNERGEITLTNKHKTYNVAYKVGLILNNRLKQLSSTLSTLSLQRH